MPFPSSLEKTVHWWKKFIKDVRVIRCTLYTPKGFERSRIFLDEKSLKYQENVWNAEKIFF